MTVHALIATYNRRDVTLACLARLQLSAEMASTHVRIVIFDDGSTDGTAEAVSALFPDVVIVHGDGTAFWAASMAAAENVALGRAAADDCFLWLNDDVELDDDALLRLITASRSIPNRVLIGATQDPTTGTVSYGGFKRKGWHPLKFQFVLPANRPKMVDAFNGNVVLVPVDVARAMGGINGRYSHAFADIDYGLRLAAAGRSALLLPGTFGSCEKNPGPKPGPILDEWRYFRSAKGGGNLGSLHIFYGSHAPKRRLIAIAYTYMSWWLRAVQRTVLGRRTHP
jgi:GT2 family glycosyltransferase